MDRSVWREVLEKAARDNALARENRLTDAERFAKIRATIEADLASAIARERDARQQR